MRTIEYLILEVVQATWYKTLSFLSWCTCKITVLFLRMKRFIRGLLLAHPMRTSSEYLGQVRISRLSGQGQGQGHRSVTTYAFAVDLHSMEMQSSYMKNTAKSLKILHVVSDWGATILRTEAPWTGRWLCATFILVSTEMSANADALLSTVYTCWTYRNSGIAKVYVIYV